MSRGIRVVVGVLVAGFAAVVAPLAPSPVRRRWWRTSTRVGGRYYVRVASHYATGAAECGATTSRKVRVRRR